ncbi:hypothetical protein FA95DRAFT_872870 [Auriscalpium vulgare]|uniref:Uncharacterized protein n=1 Tax=Auriscalpium vulgare TaxID=40419 RepID=A0ACB8RZV9_9AGAM|nr:hypothetical protein FA95DRAFT_872870 [Auriscalpium vulgare]
MLPTVRPHLHKWKGVSGAIPRVGSSARCTAGSAYHMLAAAGGWPLHHSLETGALQKGKGVNDALAAGATVLIFELGTYLLAMDDRAVAVGFAMAAAAPMRPPCLCLSAIADLISDSAALDTTISGMLGLPLHSCTNAVNKRVAEKAGHSGRPSSAASGVQCLASRKGRSDITGVCGPVPVRGVPLVNPVFSPCFHVAGSPRSNLAGLVPPWRGHCAASSRPVRGPVACDPGLRSKMRSLHDLWPVGSCRANANRAATSSIRVSRQRLLSVGCSGHRRPSLSRSSCDGLRLVAERLSFGNGDYGLRLCTSFDYNYNR